jgi:hypothetical protein
VTRRRILWCILRLDRLPSFLFEHCQPLREYRVELWSVYVRLGLAEDARACGGYAVAPPDGMH